MLRLPIRHVINNIFTKAFFSEHREIPSKLPKYTDQFIYFNVKNVYGYWEKIPAIAGQTVLNALLRMQVKQFQSELCLGYDQVYQPHERPHDPFSDGPKCAYCRILMLDNWYGKVMTQTEGMPPEQQRLLNQVQDKKSNTRLACCIPVEKWMDGMTFEINPLPVQGNVPQLV